MADGFRCRKAKAKVHGHLFNDSLYRPGPGDVPKRSRVKVVERCMVWLFPSGPGEILIDAVVDVKIHPLDDCEFCMYKGEEYRPVKTGRITVWQVVR